MNRCESLRRKDICITCNDYKPIKAKKNCQNCWHKIKNKTRPSFFLQTAFTNIKQRCNNKNNTCYSSYKGKLECTRKEFLDKFNNDPIFLKIYKEWQESNYDYKLTPSVDRIDNSKNYNIDNIQILTHSANALKDSKKTPIIQYTKKDKEFIQRFISMQDAARKTGVQQSNIWKTCNGERKSAGGYFWRYE